jgi:hypothetical protein
MRGQDQGKQYQSNVDEFLRQTRDSHLINPATGIYEPHSLYVQKAENRPKPGSISEQPFFVSSNPLWTDRFTAVAATVGALTSAATLILLILTVWYAHKQWQEAKRTADAAVSANGTSQKAFEQSRKQFSEEQRPYVWVTATGLGGPEYYLPPEIKPSDMSPHGQIYWTFHYTNYGKAFAKNLIFSSSEIRLGKESHFRRSNGFIPLKVGMPLPTSKDDFRTIVSEPGISKAEYDKLMNQDMGISIRMKAIYTDLDGGDYETSMCFTRLKTGAIQYCDMDNYMK